MHNAWCKVNRGVQFTFGYLAAIAALTFATVASSGTSIDKGNLEAKGGGLDTDKMVNTAIGDCERNQVRNVSRIGGSTCLWTHRLFATFIFNRSLNITTEGSTIMIFDHGYLTNSVIVIPLSKIQN
jgi:hypothetical protein